MEGATLKDVAPLCDVVISGVPGDKYKFDTSLLREGAVCINFSSEKVGFVRYPMLSPVVRYFNIFSQNFGPEVKEKASIFVPSIGKVTIVVLLRNLLVCLHCSSLDIHDISQHANKRYRDSSRTVVWTTSSLRPPPSDQALWRRLPKRLPMWN